MVRRVFIAALALGACTRERLGGIQATLRFAPTTPARCARVYATAEDNQHQLKTGPLLNPGRDVQVGIGQGDLGRTITVEAHGYDNETCNGPWVDDSNIASVTFVGGTIVTDVLLVLDGRPQQGDGGTEICDNGVDDDGDTGTDCQDPECDRQSCGAPNYCSMLMCRRPMTEMNCIDGNDEDMDGTTDCADTDCANQSCIDGERCTTDDKCLGGTCRGTPTVCNSPGLCQVAGTGTCQVADGTCSYTARSGTCGDAGTCMAGECMLQLPFTPTNIPREFREADVAGPLTLDCGNTTFDTDTLTWSLPCANQVMPRPVLVNQPSGAPVLVTLAVSGFTVASNSTLFLQGSRPFALAVFGDANVQGRIDADADHEDAGPGALPNCLGNAGPGKVGTNAGGGGAGHRGDGEQGGDAFGDQSSGGAGGTGSSNTALSPLRGGCTGGLGGVSVAALAANGGAGGGAFQLTVAGTLTVAGRLTAAGGGGRGATALRGGGGGGGSGGGILLEATQVSFTGMARVLALGGGGGGGAQNATAGTDGQNGHDLDINRANGGNRGGGEAGNGGDGENVTNQPQAGEDGNVNGGNVGGGGGGGAAMGRIVIHGNCSKANGVETAPDVACP